jgi:hypothetical protein
MRRLIAWPAGLVALVLLAGCVSIPTGGGVTTAEVEAEGPENPLLSLPNGPAEDASPEEIVAEFLRAGRGPQENYKVAREFLTDDFRSTWIPGARTLISSTPITPVPLADNTWSVSISTTASLDNQGRYQAAASPEGYDLTFGLVQNADGQWRISSAPDGTVLSPNRFESIYAPFEVYFFDPSFAFLVPDLRWFRSGTAAAGRVVDALLAGPDERLGSGALYSAFPPGTEQTGDLTLDSGVAVVQLSSDVNAGGAAVHRRMEQQLLQSLRSVVSVRDVEISVNNFTLQIPEGGAAPDSTYLVGNDPIGGTTDGQIGVLSGSQVTPIPGIGRSADIVGATGGSIVSRDRDAIVLLSDAGVSVVRAGQDPAVIDGRSGLVAPSLDPLGYTWTVPAGSPGQLLAIGPDATTHVVPGLPSDATVVSLDVSRDGARVLVALESASGPRLVVLGIQRDADLVPTALITPLDLPIGDDPLLDAAWVDGVTVVALTDRGDSTAVHTYDIGGQTISMGELVGGRSIVGGNTVEGTRVLTVDGSVMRPGGGDSWQDTGTNASFLVTQQ